MEIIDFHMHPPVGCDANFCHFKEAVGNSEATVLADLQKAGISRFCGSVIYREEDPVLLLEKTNEAALSLRERFGGAYIPGMMIHPAAPKESCEWLLKMHKAGCRLIGEVVPYIHNWVGGYDAEGLSEILTLAEELSMVVSYHGSDAVDVETKMVKAHPNLPFVMAHPGEKKRFMAALDVMKQCDNFYLDLSGGNIFRYGMLAEGVRTVGAERFLFGTDYPICTPPAYVSAVEYEPITDADKELIFSGNAKRLLGL